jgi:hypothetical protein
VIVHLYDKFAVNRHLKNIGQISKKLQGWYTVLTLSKNRNGRMMMDAFSDSTRLNSFYIPALGTRVYSTSESDIEATAKIFGYKLEDLKTIKQNTAFRIDVLTGQVVQETSFSSNKELRGNVQYASGNFDDEDMFKRFFGV